MVLVELHILDEAIVLSCIYINAWIRSIVRPCRRGRVSRSYFFKSWLASMLEHACNSCIIDVFYRPHLQRISPEGN